MVADQFLACAAHEVLSVELRCHRAPDLCALDTGNKSTLLQLQPVGLIKLWSNQKVEIRNFVVFSQQSRGQAEFAV